MIGNFLIASGRRKFMKVAIIALTKNASKLANEIGQKLKGDVYVKEKYSTLKATQ